MGRGGTWWEGVGVCARGGRGRAGVGGGLRRVRLGGRFRMRGTRIKEKEQSKDMS